MAVENKHEKLLQLGYELLVHLLNLKVELESTMRLWASDGDLILEVTQQQTTLEAVWVGKVATKTVSADAIRGKGWRAVVLRMMAVLADGMEHQQLEVPRLGPLLKD